MREKVILRLPKNIPRMVISKVLVLDEGIKLKFQCARKLFNWNVRSCTFLSISHAPTFISKWNLIKLNTKLANF